MDPAEPTLVNLPGMFEDTSPFSSPSDLDGACSRKSRVGIMCLRRKSPVQNKLYGHGTQRFRHMVPSVASALGMVMVMSSEMVVRNGDFLNQLRKIC